MKTTIWQDFFRVKGEYAMRNLLAFIGVIVGSCVVIYLAVQDTLNAEIFGIYMAATGCIYGVGKYQDEATKRKEME